MDLPRLTSSGHLLHKNVIFMRLVAEFCKDFCNFVFTVVQKLTFFSHARMGDKMSSLFFANSDFAECLDVMT